MLVDSNAHPKLFRWVAGDSNVLVHENKCLHEIAEQAESFTGRKIASWRLIGGYGNGIMELIEYVYDSPDDRWAVLIVVASVRDPQRPCGGPTLDQAGCPAYVDSHLSCRLSAS